MFNCGLRETGGRFFYAESTLAANVDRPFYPRGICKTRTIRLIGRSGEKI